MQILPDFKQNSHVVYVFGNKGTIAVLILKLSFVMSLMYVLIFVLILLYNIDIWVSVYEVFIQRILGGFINLFFSYNEGRAEICILNLHGGNEIVKVYMLLLPVNALSHW